MPPLAEEIVQVFVVLGPLRELLEVEPAPVTVMVFVPEAVLIWNALVAPLPPVRLMVSVAVVVTANVLLDVPPIRVSIEEKARRVLRVPPFAELLVKVFVMFGPVRLLVPEPPSIVVETDAVDVMMKSSEVAFPVSVPIPVNVTVDVP